MGKTLLPEPTLRRLPWYLAYVSLLNKNHQEYVSSTQISKEINVEASQIAKDLSFLNIKGKTRIGYEVATLVKELSDFLGFTRRHDAFIIGVGSLGGALMRDSGLQQYGLNIVAGFDVDPEKYGTTLAETPIFAMTQLAEQHHKQEVNIAILCVPAQYAQQVTDQIIAAGILNIWNFTPVRIKVPDNVVLQNTSIYAHLALMFNRMDARNNNDNE